MKNIVALLFLFLLCLGVQAQPIQRNYFTTNVNPQLNITNGNLISTNIYVSNVFATNITVNNITNLNTFNGRTTITTNLYVTNGFITYLTNNTFYTTNVTEQFVTNQLSYITNLYSTFITNDFLYTTNLYTTNLFATYVTNNTDYITNLYGPFITNYTLYSSNAYITNLFVDNIITNNITTNLTVNNLTVNTNAYISNAYITNLNVSYVTNLQDIVTNLYVSNAFFTNLTVEFITNDFLFTTNLYTSNAFITNLTANYITNNTLITTNAFISNAFITNITIFEAQWDTNKWVGPTNDIDFSFGTYQKFLASTDMEITGLKGVNPTNENTTVLLLDPGGSTRTLYFPNNWTNYTLDKANSYTIGSTNIAIVTISQYGQENTNVLVRIWGVIPTATTAQVWSNYQGFIFPAGELAPQTNGTTPGPAFFFRKDGSLFSPTNVTSANSPVMDYTTIFPFYLNSQVYSNEPNRFILNLGAVDYSSGADFYTFIKLDGTGDKDNGAFVLEAESVITNGVDYDFKVTLSPSAAGSDSIILATNGAAVFSVDTVGKVTANAFTDKSFAANGVVTNDSTGLLHTTPTLPSTLLPTDLAYTDKNNAFTTASSNYVAMTVTTSTNLVWGPDFSVPESLISTNAAFTMVSCVGVDTTKKEVQWTAVNVTNVTAAAVAITGPPNVHMVGTWYVTNWTTIWFQCYANAITNGYSIPVF